MPRTFSRSREGARARASTRGSDPGGAWRSLSGSPAGPDGGPARETCEGAVRPACRSRSRGFTVVEVIIAVMLLVLLLGAGMYVFVYGGRSTGRVTQQIALQQAARKGVVRFLREVQEGMEVIKPAPGSTLPYALIRDKVSLVRWFYQVPQQGPPAGLFEMWRSVNDPTLPPERQNERLLWNIKRLAFTSRSEGALQINLMLQDEAQEYSILTTVRLRNLPSAEEVW